MNESPVFTKTHDLLLWLLPATRKFPRDQRFVLARRLQDQAFALQDALVSAGIDALNRQRYLVQADTALTGLRKTLLLCHQMQLLSDGQYRHASGMTAEVGRLLGSWRAKTG